MRGLHAGGVVRAAGLIFDDAAERAARHRRSSEPVPAYPQPGKQIIWVHVQIFRTMHPFVAPQISWHITNYWLRTVVVVYDFVT
jgi:hypothetical protein